MISVRKAGVFRAAALGVLALAITACTTGPAAYRDASVAMGQTVRYVPDAMAGTWFVIARFGAEGPEVMTFDPEVEAFRAGQSEYRVGGKAGVAVMWVDTGYRTAVIGAANGSAGFILDRTPQSAPDRVAAGREILEFYGWDIRQLETIK